ncbi:MAG TPA: hypothetical protein VEF04_15605 [Blastocatellia bacterium]|nr:hypothetical protein [Blastocatellia bacterium]
MGSRILPLTSAPAAAFSALAPARRVLACGEGAPSLAMELSALSVCEGRPVVFLCGDNRFDPYVVSAAARRRGLNQGSALERILIARAFTAYQLSELVLRLKAPQEQQGFVIISGLCASFFDEDLSHNDAARLFYRTLWRIVELTQTGLSLLIAEKPVEINSRRAYFLTDLIRLSQVVLRLDGRESFRLEHKTRPAQTLLLN